MKEPGLNFKVNFEVLFETGSTCTSDAFIPIVFPIANADEVVSKTRPDPEPSIVRLSMESSEKPK